MRRMAIFVVAWTERPDMAVSTVASCPTATPVIARLKALPILSSTPASAMNAASLTVIVGLDASVKVTLLICPTCDSNVASPL